MSEPSAADKFRCFLLGFTDASVEILPNGLRLTLRPSMVGPAGDRFFGIMALLGIALGSWIASGTILGGIGYAMVAVALLALVVPRLAARHLDAEISGGMVRATERHPFGLPPASWTEPLAAYAPELSLHRWTSRQRALNEEKRREDMAITPQRPIYTEHRIQHGVFMLRHKTPGRSLLVAQNPKGPLDGKLAAEINQALLRAAETVAAQAGQREVVPTSRPCAS